MKNRPAKDPHWSWPLQPDGCQKAESLQRKDASYAGERSVGESGPSIPTRCLHDWSLANQEKKSCLQRTGGLTCGGGPGGKKLPDDGIGEDSGDPIVKGL